ncbi:hypothetical protein [Bradyrhizobium sp. CCBAU 51753]|uniref:hypothetical protein n=1 Tax=Bradyrhizobium sp. CCBAU 51753 TaxID=1325100 RepID=UPI00188CC147|nr:hypothetical protein [Bradyrhizobium sp. CCBAU 51753]
MQQTDPTASAHKRSRNVVGRFARSGVEIRPTDQQSRQRDRADVARFVPRFMLSAKKDWHAALRPSPCAGKAAHHISAPQFLGAGLGSQTAQLRIVEMDYGLPRFS